MQLRDTLSKNKDGNKADAKYLRFDEGVLTENMFKWRPRTFSGYRVVKLEVTIDPQSPPLVKVIRDLS